MNEVVDDAAEETRAASRPLSPSGSAPRVVADRYITTAEIGRGGMGVVYRAFDPKLGREVALKCVRAAALDPEAEKRMAREARAMAKLNHPNVVGIFDVVADGPNLVLAMEFVRGLDLGAWLDRERRSPQEIVAKFVAAGRGLAAAHDCGLVHRDFKAGNVLVADDGRVLVTDFGLARFRMGLASDDVEPQDCDPTRDALPAGELEELTEPGIALGTPAYMAPEQHRDREIDHRADIYAFCACLWRALAGAPPFGRDSSLEGVLSRKLAGPPSWPKAARAPRRIVAAIERGMAPEPQDRWGSMHELLAVLERRTGRRRSAQLMAVGLLGLGTTGLLAWYETRRQVCAGGAAELETVLDASTPDQIEEAMLRGVPSYAAESWPTLEASLGEYADAWKSEYRRACESTHITKEQSEEVLDLRIACLRRAKLKLGVTISLLRGGDPGALERAFDLVAELHPVAACGDVQRLLEEAPPFSDRAMAEAVAAAREELDAIETREVAGLYGEALEDIRDLTARSSGVPYPLLRAELEFTTGSLLESLGRYEEAVPHLQRAAELALGSRTSTLAGDAANTLAFVEGYHLRRADVANTWLTVGLALASPRPGDRDLEGDLYATRADVLVAAGRYDEAERDYRRAIEIRSNTRGPESPDVAAIRDNLGAVLRTVGRYEDAELERRAAWEILRKTLGAAHPGALTAGLNLASVLQVRGRVADAARLYQDLLPPLERALGGKHPKVIGTRFNLGLTVCSSGDFETGIPQLQRALEDYRSLPDANTAAILQMRQNIGDMLLRDGRYAEGFSLMEQTAADATVQLEPGDAQLGWILGTLGTLASRLSDFEIASTSLERASSHPTLPPAGRAKFLFELAKVRAAQRRPDEARTLGHQALGVLEREADLEPNETEESQREIRTWLARRDE